MKQDSRCQSDAPVTWVTATELADMLKIHVATVHRQAAAGKIPFIHIGKIRRFPLERVQEALSQDARKEN